MYGLIQALWAEYIGRNEQTWLILGLCGSGKSLLFDRLRRIKGALSTVNEKRRSVSGFRVSQLNINGCRVRLQDLGGEMEQSTWPQYYKGINKVIYVIKNDGLTFEMSLSTLESLLADLPEGVSVIIVVNVFDGLGFLSKEYAFGKTRAFCSSNRIERVLCDNLWKFAAQTTNKTLIEALVQGGTQQVLTRSA